MRDLAGLGAGLVSARPVDVEDLAHERGFPETERNVAGEGAIGQLEIGHLQVVDVNPELLATSHVEVLQAEKSKSIAGEFRIAGVQKRKTAQLCWSERHSPVVSVVGRLIVIRINMIVISSRCLKNNFRSRVENAAPVAQIATSSIRFRRTFFKGDGMQTALTRRWHNLD